MTNAEIIATNTALLIKDGIIKETNVINTFVGWKMRGYKIKKGAEHVAEFAIWKKSKKKQEVADEEEDGEPKKKYRDFILVKAFWFTDEQVEPIK